MLDETKDGLAGRNKNLINLDLEINKKVNNLFSTV